jgi:O-methyltransferase
MEWKAVSQNHNPISCNERINKTEQLTMNKTVLTTQYIDLLKKSLLNELYIENEARLVHTFLQMASNLPLNFGDFFHITRIRAELIGQLREGKLEGNTIIPRVTAADGTSRQALELRNVTELSHTMIGRKRLENLQLCVETVLADNIKGDFIETGIWRGGACIFMQGILMAYGATDRTVWAADSFEGVPSPTLAEDQGFDISAKVLPILAVSLEEVRELFSRYGLLGENIQFLKGWFKDTLATAPIKQLAILRLDGDLYESTMDALVPLYDKVTPGGFVIVDDYESCPPCKHAINDFREQRKILEPLQVIDGHGAYWRKH